MKEIIDEYGMVIFVLILCTIFAVGILAMLYIVETGDILDWVDMSNITISTETSK